MTTIPCRYVTGGLAVRASYHPENPCRADRATVEQLRGLPPTLLLGAETDVVCSEGESYAVKLRLTGVAVPTVRYDSTRHGFMDLNALRQTNAARAVMTQAIAFFRDAFANG